MNVVASSRLIVSIVHMRILFLVALAIVAFALNSVLTRAALQGLETGAASFGLIRIVAGAAFLYFLVMKRQGVWAPKYRFWTTFSLALYVIGFSFAYLSLDAGLGALLLFAVVQLTLFAFAIITGERIGFFKWFGAGLAFSGVVVLVSPSSSVNLHFAPVALMICAAVGWGIYTALGRRSADPLRHTAENFVWAAPLALLVFLVMPDQLPVSAITLAVISGAFTSGLGYAIWYKVLPNLETSIAAILQLSVPVIAAGMGYFALGEIITFKFWVATGLVVAGTAVALWHSRTSP